MTAREQELLITLVDHYIADGQPVGSKTLSQSAQRSPATIRNIMAALEEKGFLSSPHTSAGRIPTDSGYRFFADSVLSSSQSSNRADELAAHMNNLQGVLQSDLSADQILPQITHALSSLTQLAGLVTLPMPREQTLSHIEFLQLNDTRLLTVIVLDNNEVLNRIIDIDEQIGESILQQASNYLNQHYTGKSLTAIKQLMQEEIEQSRQKAKAEMQRLFEAANEALSPSSDTQQRDFVVSGETNLMNISTVEQMDALKSLFEALREKTEFYQLFDRCVASDDVQIYIGQESGHEMLKDYAVVTAPYKSDGEIVGVLGVIGPTRMPYQEAIRIVDITSKVFGSVLNSA